jgi:hypothetical protein
MEESCTAKTHRSGAAPFFTLSRISHREQSKKSKAPGFVRDGSCHRWTGRRSARPSCRGHFETTDGTSFVWVRRSVFDGRENTTKSDKGRFAPVDASVIAEIDKHLAGRTNGYVFQTRNGTPLRLSNVLEDSLHPILDELGILGQLCTWVYSGVSPQVIRDWAGHGSVTSSLTPTRKRCGSITPRRCPRSSRYLNWTQAKREESGASAQRVVN